jgi:hypothetical protein
MPYKIVAINQQSFSVSTPAQSSTFNFSQIYKTGVNQRFLVKCIGLGWSCSASVNKTSPEPHVFLLKGLQGFRGSFSYSTNSGQESKSGVPLGILGSGAVLDGTDWVQSNSSMSSSSVFMLNEIPLDSFQIEILDIDSTKAVDAHFWVQLQIETIEDY